MTAPASRWKLGLFVVASGAAGMSGLTYVGMQKLKRTAHPVYAYFDEALTGLEEGSPVRFRGVTIGVVHRIRVAADKKHLEVVAMVYEDYMRDLGLDPRGLEGDLPLPERLRAQVVMSWVTSTAFIQVDFFADPRGMPQLLPFPVPGDRPTLRTVPSTAKSLEEAVREVLGELPQVTLAARELAATLRSELQAVRLPELSRRLQSVLERIDQQLEELHAQGTVAAATAALQAVRDAAATLRDDDSPLGRTLSSWQELGQSLRREVESAALVDTSAELRAAAGGIAEVATDVRRELQQFRSTLAAVERLAALLERDPGALLHGRAASRSPLEASR